MNIGLSNYDYFGKRVATVNRLQHCVSRHFGAERRPLRPNMSTSIDWERPLDTGAFMTPEQLDLKLKAQEVEDELEMKKELKEWETKKSKEQIERDRIALAKLKRDTVYIWTPSPTFLLPCPTPFFYSPPFVMLVSSLMVFQAIRQATEHQLKADEALSFVKVTHHSPRPSSTITSRFPPQHNLYRLNALIEASFF